MAPTKGEHGSSSARCAALMGKQRGLITRKQAIHAGLSERQIDHRLATGIWRPAHPGVYMAIECSNDWRQRAMAACLWAGGGAAVSHRSAGLMWGLDGIVTALVDITTPRALSDPRVVIHRSRLLTRDHVTRVGGIPVTTPTRTLSTCLRWCPPKDSRWRSTMLCAGALLPSLVWSWRSVRGHPVWQGPALCGQRWKTIGTRPLRAL